MAGLFGGQRAQYRPPATGLRVTSALYGRPKPIVWGQARLAATVVSYAGFSSRDAQRSGKGGVMGGGKGGSGSYDYHASVVASLGEPSAGVLAIYDASAVDFIVTPPAATLAALAAIGVVPNYGNQYNVEFHYGGATQAPSPYWQAQFPSSALAYRQETTVVFPNLDLGSSPGFPNFNFEVLGAINSAVPALGPDANPADVFADFLVNVGYGVQGFPASALGDFATARTFWQASGLLISEALTASTEAASFLKERIDSLCADFRMSNGKLDIVPFGDVAISGNGATYAPNVAPVEAIGPDDLLANAGGSGAGRGAVAVTRADPTSVPNKVTVEYLDRINLYNPALTDASDAADLAATWPRVADVKSHHWFAMASAASASAALQLHRAKAAATSYQVTVGPKFALVEPLDLVTLTYPPLGLAAALCRVLDIEEQADRSLVMTLEPVPLTATAPIVATQRGIGAGRNDSIAAAPVNAPLIYEPPPALTGGVAQVWLGASGGNSGVADPNWGGCYVWLSFDGQTYSRIGTIASPLRQGALTAPLPAASGWDATDALAVNVAESAATFVNSTQAGAEAGATLCLVDGELLAFATATLTGANAYSFSGLARGLYGTSGAAHATGASFARLDTGAAIFAYDLPQDLIGKTLWLKFQSFNLWQGGVEDLASCVVYQHALAGAGVRIPADVAGLGASFAPNAVTWTLSASWTPDPNSASYQADVSVDGGATWQTFYSGAAPQVSEQGFGYAPSLLVRVKGISGAYSSPAWTQVSVTAPPQPVRTVGNAGFTVAYDDIMGGAIGAIAAHPANGIDDVNVAALVAAQRQLAGAMTANAAAAQASTAAAANAATLGFTATAVKSVAQTVEVRAGAAAAAISSEATTRANADNALSSKTDSLHAASVDAQDAATVAAIVSAAEQGQATATTLQGARSALALVTANSAATTALGAALASSSQSLSAQVGAAAAAISSEATTRANADNALSSQITTLTATVNSNYAAYQSTTNAQATTNQSVATNISNLQTSVNGNTASISTNSAAIASINGLLGAAWSVKLDVNGYISGVELVNGGSGSSSFNVRADSFNLVLPGYAPTPVMTVQNVNGAPTLALHGNIIADGTVQALAIAAQAITATSTAAGGASVNTISTTMPVQAGDVLIVFGTAQYYNGNGGNSSVNVSVNGVAVGSVPVSSVIYQSGTNSSGVQWAYYTTGSALAMGFYTVTAAGTATIACSCPGGQSPEVFALRSRR